MSASITTTISVKNQASQEIQKIQLQLQQYQKEHDSLARQIERDNKSLAASERELANNIDSISAQKKQAIMELQKIQRESTKESNAVRKQEIEKLKATYNDEAKTLQERNAVRAELIKKDLGVARTYYDELISMEKNKLSQLKTANNIIRKESESQLNLKKSMISQLQSDKGKQEVILKEATESIEKHNQARLKARKDFESEYLNSSFQNKYNESISKINKLEAEGIVTTKEKEKALKNAKNAMLDAEKTTSNLTNSVVRHLRQIETLIVSYYMLSSAWKNTFGVGIEVNKIVESNTYGIAALISANTQMVDSQGNTLTSIEKFTKAQEYSKDILAQLRVESVKTYATFPQLIEIFQQATGQTLSMGNAFGGTIDEINKNTIKLASRMSNIAGAIGMPMDRVREEIRSLMSANASTDSLIATMIFGSPSEANNAIREAKKKANGLQDLLDLKFKPFDILADTKSFSKSVLEIQAAWQNLMGDMLEKSGAFKDITNSFYRMADEIKTNSDDIIKSFDSIYNRIGDVLDILGDIAMGAAFLYAGGKLVKGLDFADDKFKKLNVSATGFKGAIEGISKAIMALPISRLVIAANALTLGYASYKSDQNQENLDKNTQEKINEIKKLSEEAQKTQANAKSQIVNFEAAQLELEKKASTSLYISDEQIESYKQQHKEIYNQIQLLEQRASITDEEAKKAKENLKTAEQTAQLVQARVQNKELLDDATKYIDKTKEKLIELNEIKSKFAEEEKRLQKELIETQSKTYVDAKQKELALKLVKDDLDKISKATLSVDKEIVNEKDKQLKKSIEASEAESQRVIKQNKALAEAKAIELELQMLRSKDVDYESLKIYQAESSIKILREKQYLLNEGVEKNKVSIELEKELIALENLKTEIAINNTVSELDFYREKLQLQDASIQKEKELQAIAYAIRVLNIEKQKDKTQTQKDLEIQKETELYNLMVERMNLLEETEFQNTMKSFYDDMIDSQLSLNSAVYDFGSGFDEVSSKIGNISKSIAAMTSLELTSKREASKLDKKYIEQFNKYAGDVEKTAELEKSYTKDTNKLKEQGIQSQIAGYANIANAMSQMFEEGSREAAAFQVIESGLAVIGGIKAILTQGTGDPYSAFARMAAMAASVAALLSSAKIAFNFGSMKETTTSDAVSAMAVNEGTGSVLGDATAQSESIKKSLEILEGYASPQFETLVSMNKYLKNISDNIGGVSSLLIRTGGFAFGEGFTASSSNKQKYQIGDISKLHNIGAILDPGLALSKMFGGNEMFNNVMGVLSGQALANKILGGVFGKTSVSQALTDSGIYFADTLLSTAADEILGQAYQTIATVTTKKSWFGKSSNTVIQTYFDSLDDEINRQFSLVLSNLYNAVLTAGDALDISSNLLAGQLNNFVVSIGKISLKGKTGEQIQEQLEAVFGKVSDDLAKAMFPALEEFQKIGEGLFETMTRVAVGMEEAEYYIGRLGSKFEDVIYTAIGNKQGDIGFEALLQSIVKTDEATYGLNNNLVQIIGSLQGTAEELYGTYNTLDTLRTTLGILNIELEALSFSSIKGAGGIEMLVQGMSDYVENFLSEEEKLSHNTILLIKEFERFNQAMPISKEGFRELIEGLDVSTESGQELYGRLISLSGAFSNISEETKKSIELLEQQLQEEKNIYKQGLEGVASIGKGFLDITEIISNAIKTLRGNLEGNNSLDAKIEEYWKNRDEIDTLLAKGADISSVESERLKKLATEVSGLATGIQSESKNSVSMTQSLIDDLEGINSKIDFSNQIMRVDIVEGLGDLLGLTESQLEQLKQVSRDGNITAQELESIKGLNEEQKKGIVEFANNTGYISTESTLSVLAEYSRQQLDALRSSKEQETEKLSKETLTTGNYIGTQEKIDIANTLGISYETAKPLIEKLQGLSGVSKDVVQKELKSIIGYDGISYNKNQLTQIERLKPYLNENIVGSMESIKQEGLTNRLKEIERLEGMIQSLIPTIEPLEKNIRSKYEPTIADAKNQIAYLELLKPGQSSTTIYYLTVNQNGLQERINTASAMMNQELTNSIGGINSKITEYQQGINKLKQYTMQGYAVGSTEIPYDQIAQIHKGEMILPQTFADGVRKGEINIGSNTNNNDNDGIINTLNKIDKKLENIETSSSKTAKVLNDAQLGVRPITTKI